MVSRSLLLPFLVHLRKKILSPAKSHRSTLLTYRQISLPTSSRILLGSVLFAGSEVSELSVDLKSEKNKYNKSYKELLKKSCLNNELRINELMKTLEEALRITSEKYRNCLEEQINILKQGHSVDPLDKYWDKLVPHRVEADNLKTEFESYRSMVDYIGQLAFNMAFCAAAIENLDAQDLVCGEFQYLEQITKEQINENMKKERILLEVNKRNIMNIPNLMRGFREEL